MKLIINGTWCLSHFNSILNVRNHSFIHYTLFYIYTYRSRSNRFRILVIYFFTKHTHSFPMLYQSKNTLVQLKIPVVKKICNINVFALQYAKYFDKHFRTLLFLKKQDFQSLKNYINSLLFFL